MKNMTFDWNDLKFFLAVARSGGLSTAACALGTSASTVSRHVDALEKRLERKLFLRQQSGYLLTDDGASLLARAEQVEEAMLAAERSMHGSAHQEVSGIVRLATTGMLAQYFVIPGLPALRARHPALRIELDIAMERVNLARREADLALRMVAPDDTLGDYVAKRIGRVDFGLYRAHDASAAWRTLDYISWEGAWDELPMAKWLSSTFDDKPPSLTCNSLPAQIAAVRARLGIGMLPCFLGDHDPMLRRIEPSVVPVSRELWLMYHRDLRGSVRIAAMRDFITELATSLLQH
jgi:DNA-binding transcriptional LysR family regulator